MRVERKRFHDRSDVNPDGTFDYAYDGETIEFHHIDDVLVFRRYDDEPEHATLQSPGGWRPDVYASRAFDEAVAWMRRHTGINHVNVYDPETGVFTSLVDARAAAKRLGL